MGDYVITSASDPRFHVRVGNCSLDHAQSVLDQLVLEPTCPSDLTLAEDTPAVAERPRRPWYRRFF